MIENLKNDIGSIQEKINSIDEQIDRKRKEISDSGWENDDARKFLRTLKDDRQLLESVLEEKRESLTVLEKQEERNRNIETLKELAEQAVEMQERYKKLLHEIDEFLTSKIPNLVNVQARWRKIGSEFNSIADQIEKGFKLSTSHNLSVNGRREELTSKKLIAELESDGVVLDAVLSETAISHRYFNHTRPALKTDELNFIQAIHEMKRQRNIAELMEREPETA